MAWPTPQDYNEAIQNPALNFADPELQKGTPERTALGLPRPISGNFASVYRMHCTGRDWAVRCFFRELADTQQRYAAISSHLRQVKLPYTVGFDYLPQGIKVRGTWYPILKMEWVEGELLHAYVEKHLQQPKALAALADQWLRMIAALEAAGVAHGDLQHGNVLVVRNQLKLVDYDGMFVPALAGRSSHEIGHANFQHPRRGAAHFGPGLDRFSAWVIYLSLLALSIEPELWVQTPGAGDESLLLAKADFDGAASSTTLGRLRTHGNVDVRAGAERLAAMLTADPLRLPPLAVAESSAREATSRHGSRFTVHGSRRRAPSLPGEHGAARGHAANLQASPAWVREQLAQERADRTFSAPVRGPRICLWLSAALLLVAIVPSVPLPILFPVRVMITLCVLVLANLGMLAWGYRRDPAVVARRPLDERVTEHRRALANIEERVTIYETMRQKHTSDYNRRRAQADSRRQQLAEEERRRRDNIESTRCEIVQTIEQRRREIEAWETAGLASALAAVQERHVGGILRTHGIRSAAGAGIGLSGAAVLWLAGIRSAADVSAARVAAIGRLDARQMVEVIEWRKTIEAQARRTMPKSLDAATRERVLARHRGERTRLQHRQQAAEHEAHAALEALTLHLAEKRTGIDQRLHEDERLFRERCAEIDDQIRQVREPEAGLKRRLARAHRELEPFTGITFTNYLVAVLLPRSSGTDGPPDAVRSKVKA